MVKMAAEKQKIRPDVGLRIKAIRKGKGMTLAELGTRAGLSHALLSRAENGASNLGVSSIYDIAEALEVPVSSLFESDGAALRRLPVVGSIGGPIDTMSHRDFVSLPTPSQEKDAFAVRLHDGFVAAEPMASTHPLVNGNRVLFLWHRQDGGEELRLATFRDQSGQPPEIEKNIVSWHETTAALLNASTSIGATLGLGEAGPKGDGWLYVDAIKSTRDLPLHERYVPLSSWLVRKTWLQIAAMRTFSADVPSIGEADYVFPDANFKITRAPEAKK
jgi:DNA-binding XRE family transcriptional regulator